MKLYLTDIKDADIGELQKYISWCDEKRQQSIEKYRFDADKKRGIAAGLLLRYAYRKYQMEQNKEQRNQVILKYNSYGKPYIMGEDKIYFSLSHAGDYILLAWHDSEIGADIEQVKEKKNTLAMAKRFFTEQEFQYLQSLEDEKTREREFVRIWTQKESYIKYLGVGLQYGMNSFFREENGSVIDSKSEDTNNIKIKEILDISGYCASVCYKENENMCYEDTFVIEDISIDMLIKA